MVVSFGYGLFDILSLGVSALDAKGRVWTADTVTVTANEIRTALNQPDHWLLALVYINDGKAHSPKYVRQPFTQGPGFAEASRTLRIRDLLERASSPSADPEL